MEVSEEGDGNFVNVYLISPGIAMLAFSSWDTLHDVDVIAGNGQYKDGCQSAVEEEEGTFHRGNGPTVEVKDCVSKFWEIWEVLFTDFELGNMGPVQSYLIVRPSINTELGQKVTICSSTSQRSTEAASSLVRRASRNCATDSSN